MWLRARRAGRAGRGPPPRRHGPARDRGRVVARPLAAGDGRARRLERVRDVHAAGVRDDRVVGGVREPERDARQRRHHRDVVVLRARPRRAGSRRTSAGCARAGRGAAAAARQPGEVDRGRGRSDGRREPLDQRPAPRPGSRAPSTATSGRAAAARRRTPAARLALRRGPHDRAAVRGDLRHVGRRDLRRAGLAAAVEEEHERGAGRARAARAVEPEGEPRPAASVNERRAKSSTTGCTTPSFSIANGGGVSVRPRSSRSAVGLGDACRRRRGRAARSRRRRCCSSPRRRRRPDRARGPGSARAGSGRQASPGSAGLL